MSILGISSGFHDASISIIDNDGNITYAGHSERYSKQKNDHRLNEDIFATALGTSVITDISYYEKPFLKQLRQLYQGSGFDFKQICTQQILSNSIPHKAKSVSVLVIEHTVILITRHTPPQVFKQALIKMPLW